MGIAHLDDTHDATLTSWVSSANADDTDFPIQNLPLGRFRRRGSSEPLRPAVAIGTQIVDLAAAGSAGLLPAELAAALVPGELNPFMALGRAARQSLRRTLSQALRQGAAQHTAWQACLLDQDQAELALPCRIGDYTDFYTGIHHATVVGQLFRPDNPLLPNYKWVPIGYHGRSSSIVVSGQAFRRPLGQTKGPDDAVPRFGPSRRLDHELEVGLFIGTGNSLGEPVPLDQAEDRACGLVLLNDWSARDIQAWEYQPLGPFLAKNFATTISPWIVTLEALAPFRSPFTRPAGDPAPLPYLESASHSAQGGFDIELSVWLQTPAMREARIAPQCLMQSNYRDAYWTAAQMLTHHSANGCNLQAGDLLGSGTQSGPLPGQGGSLLELTEGGKKPLHLAHGETRTFLEDGDSVALRGRCRRDGFRSIGFGTCEGQILPAPRC